MPQLLLPALPPGLVPRACADVITSSMRAFRALDVVTCRTVIVITGRIVTHAAWRTVTIIITIVAAIATAATITLFVRGLGHR